MKPKLSGSKEWLFWYEAQERKYVKESERLQALNAELLAENQRLQVTVEEQRKSLWRWGGKRH